MKLFFKVCMPCCLLFFSSCIRQHSSKIVEIDSLSKAEKAFNNANSKTLIVFDVDETILTPADAIWQKERIWDIDITKHFPVSTKIKKYFGDLKPDDNIFSNRLLHTLFRPVESNTPSIINNLQNRQLKVIALTNFGPG